MNDYDNVNYIQLFSANLPIEGRMATAEEERNIREWIRSFHPVVEAEKGIKGQARVIIHVNRGNRPIEIRAINKEQIEIIDNMGIRRVVQQAGMRAFLDNLET